MAGKVVPESMRNVVTGIVVARHRLPQQFTHWG
jgi:hypothetical protein